MIVSSVGGTKRLKDVDMEGMLSLIKEKIFQTQQCKNYAKKTHVHIRI